MGKEEIAGYEQFLLFPQCFKKACFPEASKGVIVWEWVERVNVTRGPHCISPGARITRVMLPQTVIFSAIEISLTLSQTTNFRLFQTERVCRREFQI